LSANNKSKAIYHRISGVVSGSKKNRGLKVTVGEELGKYFNQSSNAIFLRQGREKEM
jgi:hypothetical protein